VTDFARGARVRKPPERGPLTLVEASFVMVDVAKRDGLTAEQFLRFMATAWEVYDRSGLPQGGSREP
jgi:hypothetical protein